MQNKSQNALVYRFRWSRLSPPGEIHLRPRISSVHIFYSAGMSNLVNVITYRAPLAKDSS